MAQKKGTKKNVKVGDLAPKKDAKGGGAVNPNASVGLDKGTSLNKPSPNSPGLNRPSTAPRSGF